MYDEINVYPLSTVCVFFVSFSLLNHFISTTTTTHKSGMEGMGTTMETDVRGKLVLL